MATYVYRYSHPKYKWLYVGKADNTVKERVYGHSKEEKFQPFLQDVEIYYIELDNKAQSKFVETYLIDKYKPYLNKADKYVGKSSFSLNIPEWKRYNDDLIYDRFKPKQIENVWDKAILKELKELRKQVKQYENKIEGIETAYRVALNSSKKNEEFLIKTNQTLGEHLKKSNEIINDYQRQIKILIDKVYDNIDIPTTKEEFCYRWEHAFDNSPFDDSLFGSVSFNNSSFGIL